MLPIELWPDSSGWAAIPYLVIGTVAGSPGPEPGVKKGRNQTPAKTVKPTETLANTPNVHCLMCPASCALLHVPASCAPPHLPCLMCPASCGMPPSCACLLFRNISVSIIEGAPSNAARQGFETNPARQGFVTKGGGAGRGGAPRQHGVLTHAHMDLESCWCGTPLHALRTMMTQFIPSLGISEESLPALCTECMQQAGSLQHGENGRWAYLPLPGGRPSILS